MGKKLDDNTYVTLLEQTVAQGSAAAPTGPEGAGKGKGEFSKTGKESGMGYRGVTIGGDKILNWDGDGPQFSNKKLADVDDLVETITGDKYDGLEDREWDGESPMSILEIDELLEADEEEKAEEEGEEAGKEAEGDEDEDEEEEELDVDQELKDSAYADVNFTSTESEVLSRIIKEMSMLEEEADALEDLEEVGVAGLDLDDEADIDDSYDY